jgi:O-antigen/teichoic acid export membrane protein
MASASLRQKATSGLVWTTAQQLGEQGVRFVVQVVLARILLPEEFGLIAMISVFLTIGNMVAQAGMGSALVQAKELTETDIRTVYTMNLLVGLLMVAALWLSAPFISQFYQQPELVLLLRVMSLAVFLQQLGAVHASLLGRELKYRQVMFANFPGMLISGGVGIAMALNGFGVWALVAQALVMPLITSSLLWKFSGWMPNFALSQASIGKLFPFGWRVAANQLLNAVFNNIYVLVIGRIYPVAEVAYYQRAKSFQNLTTMNVLQIFNRVAFPVLSRLNSEKSDRASEGYFKLLTVASWGIIPLIAIMGAVAEPMIVLLLTDKWIATVPYLQVLCAIGVFMILNVVNVNYLQAKGRADVVLKLSMLSKLFIVISLLITFKLGVVAMLWGHFVTVLINFVIRLYVLNNHQISWRQQIKVMMPPMLLSVLIFVVSMSLIRSLALGSALELLLGGAAAGVLWWAGVVAARRQFQTDLVALGSQYPQLMVVFRCLRLIG